MLEQIYPKMWDVAADWWKTYKMGDPILVLLLRVQAKKVE